MYINQKKLAYRSIYIVVSRRKGRKMNFLCGYNTDIGIKKESNQDSLLIKIAQSHRGNIGIFVICDGMGGLSNGELASSTVILNLSKWFTDELPELLMKEKFKLEIQRSISNLVSKVNKKLVQYGEKNNIKLGTTMSALIIIDNIYMIFHVGDSRIYKLKDEKLIQITEDQTFIARELALGSITEEEAKVHPKRNTLLECIGVRGKANMIIKKGTVEKDDVFLLCSDGFYHKISKEEIVHNFNSVSNENIINNNISVLVNLAKTRGEIDNISLIVTKIS